MKKGHEAKAIRCVFPAQPIQPRFPISVGTRSRASVTFAERLIQKDVLSNVSHNECQGPAGAASLPCQVRTRWRAC
jgi:hypothetical protein